MNNKNLDEALVLKNLDEAFIYLYRKAYNDGFDRLAEKKDIIKRRKKLMKKIKKKYFKNNQK
jgi:hypothetical protein